MKYLISLSYFIKVYLTAFGWLTRAFFVDLLLAPKKSRQVLCNFLDSMDFSWPDHILPSVCIEDLLPSLDQVDVVLSGRFTDSYFGGTLRLSELSSLAYIVKSISANTILELGTFRGRTTSLFAKNVGDSCHIWTMDLPMNQCEHSIGEFFKDDRALCKKITQLYGDTSKYSFDELHQKIDFVWVDACHDYPYVQNDTEIAISCCRAGGWIAWHDYRHTASWSGVTKYIRTLQHDKRLYNLHHLLGTSIAIAQVR